MTEHKLPKEVYDKGAATDPAPDIELPSDIRFKWWLRQQKPEVVLQDLEGRASLEEQLVIDQTRYDAVLRGDPLAPRGAQPHYNRTTHRKGNS